MRLFIVILGFIWMLAACGGQSIVMPPDGSAPNVPDSAQSESTNTVDTSAPECVGLNCGSDSMGGSDLAINTTDTLTQPDVNEPPCIGCAGASCNSNTDCDSGWCLDGPNGLECASLCIDDCPSGYECKGVSNTPGDIIFVCVYQHFTYCSPCLVNDDCKSPLVQSSDNRCVEWDDQSGSFCGTGCSVNSDCAQGGQCETVIIEGESRNLCLPVTGVCECSQFAINSGAQTTCLADNAEGSCVGTRVCTADGLTDCDALTPSVEVCNGLDDDCNGVTDDSPNDLDADGISDCIDEDADGDGFDALNDCDDFNGDINPNAQEMCNGLDDDCDNLVDEEGATGCVSFYEDTDSDNYGSDNVKCLCTGEGAFDVQVSGDCNDGNNAINPGVAEVCNNIDDNCDGTTDGEASTGCTTFFLDGDQDGHGTATDSKCLCEGVGFYTALSPDDCNDNDGSNFPGNVEVCDNKDNNCDNVIDGQNISGCVSYYLDADSDNWGTSDVQCLCSPSSTHKASQPGDCNDGNPWVNPAQLETCNTPFDDDCDGNTDTPEDGSGTTYFQDVDGDNYGAGAGVKLCSPTLTYTVGVGGDCNDGASAINPGAAESCNSVDDNCNGSTDEAGASGCVTFYFDGDNDSHGSAFNNQCLCAASGQYTAFLPDDCNDNDGSMYPGNAELCDNKDNNCNNAVDESLSQSCSSACGGGVETCFFGSWTGCSAPNPISCMNYNNCSTVTTCAGACQPAPNEVCDGIDNDCDGFTDEGLLNACGTCGGAPEEVCDGVDNDCDGATDEGFLGDYTNGNVDFTDSWPVPSITSYPPSSCSSGGTCSMSGTVFGHIIPQGDVDWWSVFAQENLSDTCGWPFSDAPIKAEIQFTSPPGEWYIICACWSSGFEKCGKSENVCKTSKGVNVNITLEMDMECGESDTGYLDVEVKPHTSSLDYHCADWIATWAISEN